MHIHFAHRSLIFSQNNSKFNKCPKCTNRKDITNNTTIPVQYSSPKEETNPSYYLSRYLKINGTTEDQKIEQYVNFIITNSVPKTMIFEEVEEHTNNDITLWMTNTILKTRRRPYFTNGSH